MYNAEEKYGGMDMKAFPHISEVRANLFKLEEFLSAKPENQPDFK
jgi:hypothetical protein